MFFFCVALQNISSTQPSVAEKPLADRIIMVLQQRQPSSSYYCVAVFIYSVWHGINT